MYVVITHHFCKPEDVDAARQRIDKNGDTIAAQPGFLLRYRLESEEMPQIVSTFTAWNEEADFLAYKALREARRSGASPYEKIESQTFEVKSEHGAPQ